MLGILYRVEINILRLMAQEDKWRSHYIDYHPPMVERLVREVTVDRATYRVCLHRIHPCMPGQDLFHPHPWPSAMRILHGRCEMGIGFGPGQNLRAVLGTVTLGRGDEYEMTHPDAWHRVRPLEEPVYSLMVTGLPWDRWSPKGRQEFRELTHDEKYDIRGITTMYYGSRMGLGVIY